MGGIPESRVRVLPINIASLPPGIPTATSWFALTVFSIMMASDFSLTPIDRNLLIQGFFIGASVRPGLRGCKLLKDRDDIRFLLAGDGAERASLIVRAENFQLKNVVFLPPQPKEMMPKVWSLCDVALVHLKNSPAFAEVLPSKMFEAMGMGLPVLMALPEGEATEILELDGAGISVLPENPKALADAAQKLCDDKALLKKFQDQSLAAAPLHSREKQAQQMIDVLTAAAEGRGGSVGKSAP